MTHSQPFDLLVIGGGINGAAIARDAAGRRLSVLLCEQGDLASATSSASSKLVHGGLRYLEHFAFRLVAESLREREVLLRTAPHIVWPLRFVLPHVPALRPVWMIRAGLWLYDHIGGKRGLPGSARVSLRDSVFGDGLRPELDTGFVYSDCWVDDARFVVLNAVDAARRAAVVRTRTRCRRARREGRTWVAELVDETGTDTVTARALVNAAGPWAEEVLTGVAGLNTPVRLRHVKGSHIVVPRFLAGAHAYILQNEDGRVVFALPFERDFTLIGTTDVVVEQSWQRPAPSEAEVEYLCDAVNRYFTHSVSSKDVVWSYAGVRPLYDDGERDPSSITRDYALALDGGSDTAPALSVFGGKITTARRLAEQVVDRLRRFFPGMTAAWTASSALPGGDVDSFDGLVSDLRRDFPCLDPVWLEGLARRHGARARTLLDGVKTPDDLGPSFPGGLFGREVDWFMREEWAREAEDVLWRRTKAGLHASAADRERLADYMERIRSG